MAVLTKDKINFFQKDKSIGSIGGRLQELLSGTYDPVHGYLYLSDSNQINASIFRVNIFRPFEDAHAVIFQPVVSKQSSVNGMTFDPVTSTLFWTTGRGFSIMKLEITQLDKVSLPNFGSVLHKFDYQIPHGIAVDSCRQTLYWTNIHFPNVTIERSKTDGTGLEVIVKDDIYQPYGIEVDHKSNKIYWCDTKGSGFSYRIERSNLDGSNRERLIEAQDQYPFAISVAADKVYWTDWHHKNLLSLPKNSAGGIEPQIIKQYKSGFDGIVSNMLYFNISVETCQLLAPFISQITSNRLKEATVLTNTNLDVYTNNLDSKSVYCETVSCRNYCFAGSCKMNSAGMPVCKCNDGWSGIRCENQRCQGVCMNNGKCTINKYNETVCECQHGYLGLRCEFPSSFLDELCKPYCLYSGRIEKLHYQSLNTIQEMSKSLSNYLQSCRCSEIESPAVADSYDMMKEEIISTKREPRVPEFSARINIAIISILGILCLVLGLMVICLVTKVSALRRRPRIRKRFVVSKPSAPFMCKPQSPREQCEITIENCCNMNICETPCFEPDFKSSKATFKKLKSEDKRNLIHSNSSQEEENY